MVLPALTSRTHSLSVDLSSRIPIRFSRMLIESTFYQMWPLTAGGVRTHTLFPEARPVPSYALLLLENDGVRGRLTVYGLSGLSPRHGLAIDGDDSAGRDSSLAISPALHVE